jgi:hypothetical protein
MVNKMEDGFSLKESTIGILGLGLMGSALTIGFDSHLPTLELALSKNIIDHAGSFAQSGGSNSNVYRDPKMKRAAPMKK